MKELEKAISDYLDNLRDARGQRILEDFESYVKVEGTDIPYIAVYIIEQKYWISLRREILDYLDKINMNYAYIAIERI